MKSLKEYREMKPEHWIVSPIQSNREMTHLAILLALNYKIGEDYKVYGKGLNKNNCFSVDEKRVMSWLEDGIDRVAFMSDYGFFGGTVPDVIANMNKSFFIRADHMESLASFTTEDSAMIKFARASRRQQPVNQIKLF